MFCPKCGSQLRDGSAFCGQCGAQLGQPKATAASATAIPGASRSVSFVGMSAGRLVAIVLAAVAVVFALMPWFVTSSSLVYAGETASAVTSLLTLGSYSTAHFEDSYTVFGLMDFVRDLATYFGSSSAPGGGIVVPITACWAIGLALLVVGAILMAVRGNRVLLVVGALVLALTAVFYLLFFYGQFVDNDYAVGCINPAVCALACLASAITAIVGGGATASPKKE